MDRQSKLSTNILIISTVVAIVLFITYSIKNNRDYSFKVGSNPLMKTNDAILKLALYDEKSIDIAKSDQLLIEDNDELLLDTNHDIEEVPIIDGIEEEKIVAVDEANIEEPKDEVAMAAEVPSRGVSITDSRKSNEVNLRGSLNNYVLEVIKSYKIGNYPYLLNDDYQNYNGVTEDLYYQGELLLKANPNGNKASHCSGITFEVLFKAMQNRNKDLGIDINNFNGMNKDELLDMALIWYVANGNKNQSNVAKAVEKYGIGKQVYKMEDLRAGDFIDFSRENNTGHTAVFIDWIREGNRIIGLKYWSSQDTTKGINYKEEYFNIERNDGRKYGNIIIDKLYMARINPVSEYKNLK